MQREMPKRRNWAVIVLLSVGVVLTTFSVVITAHRVSEAARGGLLALR
jgi:hypothetical protein